MIARYHLLAQRIRNELAEIERVVLRAQGALARAKESPADQDYFLAAAALDMHSFYAGIERMFELIASEVDGNRPTGSHWHRDLLIQMTLEVAGARPPVLSAAAQEALAEYLEFRHVVRNVYTFNLRPQRVAQLVDGLPEALALVRHDLQRFGEFLDGLATADDA